MNETNEKPRDDRDPPEGWAPLTIHVGTARAKSGWCRADNPRTPDERVDAFEWWEAGRLDVAASPWSNCRSAGARETIAVACALAAIDLLADDTLAPIDVTAPDGTRYLVARVDGDVRIEIRGAR